MIAIISLLTILTLTMIVTRIATVALMHTGLSREVARFQARSALSGVGYTTSESEKIVGHPVRRRIFLLLMLVGNIGIVTVVSSLILSFMNLDRSDTLTERIIILGVGLAILIFLVSSRWIDRRLSRIISWALKRYTHIDIQDYSSLLHLARDYRVTELFVEPNDWLAEKELKELNLPAEGVLVLGITRGDGAYIGTPQASTIIMPNDNLILYGRASALENIDRRPKGKRGDRAHAKAIAEQEEVIETELEEAGEDELEEVGKDEG
jgi:hypothetical protein